MTGVAIEPTGLQTTLGKLLVSETEAAHMLSMSPRQLANLRYAGRVKFICLNLTGDCNNSKRGRRSIRYSVESLKTMIAEIEAARTGEVDNGRTK